MINFAAHEDRAGEGAHADFEKMLVQLVTAVEGEDARLIQPNPGDWGIDVLVGDLHGSVRIWQAKYFRNGATEKQQDQIRKSFASAIRAATRNGYTVQEWLLCISTSMDGPTTQWWNNWKQRQEQDTGATLTLWDETKLRQFLHRPEAAHVRRAYYDRYWEPPDSDEDGPRRPGLLPKASANTNRSWSGGDVVRIGLHEYLLHDTPQEIRSTNHSQIWREATAVQLPNGGRVRLRQASSGQIVATREAGQARDKHRQALRDQSRLLTRFRGQARLPVLVDLVDGNRDTTLITGHPKGQLWQDVFGPGPVPLDRLSAASALAAGADVCAALGRQHRQGQQHRNLSTQAIVVSPTGRGHLRDLGQAFILASPIDGHLTYRAPEQARSPYLAGAPTDIFQLSALLHHTLTGHPPTPLPPPPVRLSLPDFPTALDALLQRGLDVDPRRRPDPEEFAATLRAGQRELSAVRPW